MMVKCKDCGYFDADGVSFRTLLFGDEEILGPIGSCRRDQARAWPAMVSGSNGSHGWPHVKPTDGCWEGAAGGKVECRPHGPM